MIEYYDLLLSYNNTFELNFNNCYFCSSYFNTFFYTFFKKKIFILFYYTNLFKINDNIFFFTKLSLNVI